MVTDGETENIVSQAQWANQLPNPLLAMGQIIPAGWDLQALRMAGREPVPPFPHFSEGISEDKYTIFFLLLSSNLQRYPLAWMLAII